MGKINDAREMITKASGEINTPLSIYIEEHLNKRCTTEDVAEKLMAEGKSLKDLIKKITAEAKKQATNGVACIPDEDVKTMIDEYYGLSAGDEHAQAKVIDIMDYL